MSLIRETGWTTWSGDLPRQIRVREASLRVDENPALGVRVEVAYLAQPLASGRSLQRLGDEDQRHVLSAFLAAARPNTRPRRRDRR